MAGIVAGKVRKARERDLKEAKDDFGLEKGRKLVGELDTGYIKLNGTLLMLNLFQQ
jgi:hypothetical protein